MRKEASGKEGRETYEIKAWILPGDAVLQIEETPPDLQKLRAPSGDGLRGENTSLDLALPPRKHPLAARPFSSISSI